MSSWLLLPSVLYTISELFGRYVVDNVLYNKTNVRRARDMFSNFEKSNSLKLATVEIDNAETSN